MVYLEQMKQIYMDFAAATPVDPAVLATMQPFFTEKFYNPSAGYLAARGVSKDLAAARALVGHYIGARPAEITFMAGGTEANNLAISGVMSAFPGSKVVISAIEHDSVLQTASNHKHAEAPVNEQGIIDLKALEACIDGSTVLVSVMYANNEIGSIQPLREVAAIVDKIRKERTRSGNELPLYLHTDAAQAGNYLDIHAARLGVDLMTLNGGKIYGPKQSGILYVRSGVRIRPLIYGGGQEHNLRSGTENVPGAIGLSKALQIAQDMKGEEAERLKELQRHFIERLTEQVPEAVINGSLKKRLPNNIHVTLPGQDNERLLFALEEHGILAAAGSACSASHEESSHVLHALGLSDEAARSSLRFTMGRPTSQDEIDSTVSALARLLAR